MRYRWPSSTIVESVFIFNLLPPISTIRKILQVPFADEHSFEAKENINLTSGIRASFKCVLHLPVTFQFPFCSVTMWPQRSTLETKPSNVVITVPSILQVSSSTHSYWGQVNSCRLWTFFAILLLEHCGTWRHPVKYKPYRCLKNEFSLLKYSTIFFSIHFKMTRVYVNLLFGFSNTLSWFLELIRH